MVINVNKINRERIKGDLERLVKRCHGSGTITKDEILRIHDNLVAYEKSTGDYKFSKEVKPMLSDVTYYYLRNKE